MVVSASGTSVLVTSIDRAACARCANGQGCGGGVLGRLVRRSGPLQVLADNHCGQTLRTGDAVVIGLRDEALVGASLLVYLVPLLGMMAGAAMGHALNLGADWVVACLGIGGLLLGFAVVAMRSRQPQVQKRCRPVVLRRANPHTSASCSSRVD